jgi:hypothetical protein
VVDEVDPVDKVVERVEGDVAFLQVERGLIGQIDDVPLLERARIEVGEAVDADYLDICFEEPFREPASEKPGAAGYKYAILAPPKIVGACV